MSYSSDFAAINMLEGNDEPLCFSISCPQVTRRLPQEPNMTPTSGTSTNLGSHESDFAGAKTSVGEDASTDVEGLRRDLNSLRDTISRFVSQAGEVSSSVASQVGDAASSFAESGADVASAAKEQAKTFASELENMGRRNPLGAMATAFMIGVLVGLIGRGRGS
jgi:ElaB/YqjD/DUF883 family membrane-anchored ribosome-binding protein